MATLISSRTGRQLQLYAHGCRQVVGCIPYRLNVEGEVEVLLISSQKSPALFFPKGGWEIDEQIEAAVYREAEEEAGVLGSIQCPLGSWRFKSKSQNKFHQGYMFSLLVTEELNVWPEKDLRRRIWMSVDEARDALSPLWMKETLDIFVHMLCQERAVSITIQLEILKIEELRRTVFAEKELDCGHEYLQAEQHIVGIILNGKEVDCC